MTDLPYTDADLRAEAARQLGDDIDGLAIIADMAERAPWSALSTEDFNEAFDEVLRLTEAAADPA